MNEPNRESDARDGCELTHDELERRYFDDIHAIKDALEAITACVTVATSLLVTPDAARDPFTHLTPAQRAGFHELYGIRDQLVRR